MQGIVEPELTGLFIESAKGLGAVVEATKKNPEALSESLQQATSGEESILLAEPDYLDPALFGLFAADSRVIRKPSKEQMSSVTTGVTDAFCGVAATGSVCVAISKNLGSPMSLLTRRHIVVLDAATIVRRPRDLFSGEVGFTGLNRSFSFITGPSATADMGPLVVGVHGPGKLHIIVLE